MELNTRPGESEQQQQQQQERQQYKQEQYEQPHVQQQHEQAQEQQQPHEHQEQPQQQPHEHQEQPHEQQQPHHHQLQHQQHHEQERSEQDGQHPPEQEQPHVPQSHQQLKRKISLSGCGTCGAIEAKYRCPRCMTYSCSLSCVKKHKADAECNGVRDKTAFLAISHFNEMHLLSDYRFLEDSGRLADRANRDTAICRPSSNRRLKFMMYRARKCNINLRFLPLGFSKRKENSTCFNNKKQMFFWHLKLIFPQSETEYVEKRVPASKTLEDILKKYINPQEADPVIRQKLKAYVFTPLTEIRICMKIENRKNNSIRYFSLDSSESLTKNLEQKTIIEYPTLHIVLKMHSQRYRLLGDDVCSSENSQNIEESTSSESEEEEGEIKE